MAERVVFKEKANLCTYFQFAGRTPAVAGKEDARKKLENLFTKK